MVGTRMRYSFLEEKSSSLTSTMKTGAFAGRKRHFEEPNNLIVIDVPFCAFFADQISLGGDEDGGAQPQDNANNPEGVKEQQQQQTGVEEKNNEKNCSESNGNETTTTPTSPADSRTDQLTMVSTAEDFIMVDLVLETPFAKPSGEKFELGKFFREWQTAPLLLETFKELPPLEGQELQKQLDTFESDLNEYDSIVKTLCQSSPNNN